VQWPHTGPTVRISRTRDQGPNSIRLRANRWSTPPREIVQKGNSKCRPTAPMPKSRFIRHDHVWRFRKRPVDGTRPPRGHWGTAAGVVSPQPLRIDQAAKWPVLPRLSGYSIPSPFHRPLRSLVALAYTRNLLGALRRALIKMNVGADRADHAAAKWTTYLGFTVASYSAAVLAK